LLLLKFSCCCCYQCTGCRWLQLWHPIILCPRCTAVMHVEKHEQIKVMAVIASKRV
jgi:hypothetical protein